MLGWKNDIVECEVKFCTLWMIRGLSMASQALTQTKWPGLVRGPHSIHSSCFTQNDAKVIVLDCVS